MLNATQEGFIGNNAKNAKDAIVAFKSINFANALQDASVRTRRWLLLFSVLGIVLATNSVNLKQIPWLDIPSPDNPGDLFPTIILVAVVYHLIAFVLYATSDILQWHVNADTTVFSSRSQLIFRLDQNAAFLAEQLKRMPDMAVSPEMQIRGILEGLIEVAGDSIKNYRTFYGQSRFAHQLKVFTVWSWEFSLPILLGFLASWRLCASMMHH